MINHKNRLFLNFRKIKHNFEVQATTPAPFLVKFPNFCHFWWTFFNFILKGYSSNKETKLLKCFVSILHVYKNIHKKIKEKEKLYLLRYSRSKTEVKGHPVKKGFFFKLTIKHHLFPCLVLTSLKQFELCWWVKKQRSYSDLKFRGRSENGIESKTKAHNSATGGRRRLRFSMNKFFIKVFWHVKFDKNRKWSLQQLAEINQFWPIFGVLRPYSRTWICSRTLKFCG